jgi:hypothetical protein
MINCQKILFSQKLQEQRITQAQRILGIKVVKNFICFALYLLGIDRKSISDLLDTPSGTVRSIIRAILHDGLPALEDRRSHSSSFLPLQEKEMKIDIHIKKQSVIIDFGAAKQLKIPRQNTLQIKVILFTLLQNRLLRTSDVSVVLGLSTVHTLNLTRKLYTNDIIVLIDKRRGQKQGYRFTPDVKAELIQQFVLDIITSGKSSSKLLAKHLLKRCKLTLSERSIRDNISKLGLSRIKKSLPQLIAKLKKNE